MVSLALLVSVGVATAADPKTDDDKTFYALGIALSRNLAIFELKPSELEYVQQGLADGVLDKDKKVDFDAYSGKIQNLAKARSAVAAEGEKKAAAEFLEKAAAEKGAEDGVRPHLLGDQAGHRRRAEGVGSSEGALPRHAARRHGVRQLREAR
jgi:hypothetical protein